MGIIVRYCSIIIIIILHHWNNVDFPSSLSTVVVVDAFNVWGGGSSTHHHRRSRFMGSIISSTTKFFDQSLLGDGEEKAVTLFHIDDVDDNDDDDNNNNDRDDGERAAATTMMTENDDDVDHDDVAGLRSLTFSDLSVDQEPQLLCNFLMELGACSTCIVDANRGTNREVGLFGEPTLDDEHDDDEWETPTWDASTHKVWDLCHVSAQFPASTSMGWIMDVVLETFPNMPRYTSITKVEDKDWVLHVQQSWKPIVVQPFILRFPWHTDEDVTKVWRESMTVHSRDDDDDNDDDDNDDDDAITGSIDGTDGISSNSMVELVLQGGVAFGTGEHPTTQLCLEFVRDTVRPNMLVMDYGSGSGVLGMAACKLDPTIRAVGVDIDVDAVLIANANARINNVKMKNYLSDLQKTQDDDESTSILLRALNNNNSNKNQNNGNNTQRSGDDQKDDDDDDDNNNNVATVLPEEWNGPIYDACVANILARPLIVLAPTLAGLLRPGAPLGLSGIMKDQAHTVLQSVYGEYFDNLHVEKVRDNWVLITGRRKQETV